MTTNKEDIRRWLDLYMEGKTSLEEEALLTEYFRSPDADKDFADFKTMFDQFDEGEPSFTEEEQERWMQSCPQQNAPQIGKSFSRRQTPLLAGGLCCQQTADGLIHCPAMVVAVHTGLISSDGNVNGPGGDDGRRSEAETTL